MIGSCYYCCGVVGIQSGFTGSDNDIILDVFIGMFGIQIYKIRKGFCKEVCKLLGIGFDQRSRLLFCEIRFQKCFGVIGDEVIF